MERVVEGLALAELRKEDATVMADSSIEWTDKVWNATRGCSRVSPGCGGAKGEGGCYAERQAARFSGPGGAYEGLVRIGKQGPRWTGKMLLAASKLEDPLRWQKPAKIFVNSMSDLFHENLANEEIAAVFAVMAAAPQHTFQVLTKRAKRMREWFEWIAQHGGIGPYVRKEWPSLRHLFADGYRFATNRYGDRHRSNFDAGVMVLNAAGVQTWPLPTVWLGVSVEDQRYADERIPDLLATPAAVRFISYEPALGPVSFQKWIDRPEGEPSLSMVIVGGESGPGARAFDADWASRVILECDGTSTKAFVKQLGSRVFDSRLSTDEGEPGPIVQMKKKGGEMSEWPPELRVREFPT